MRSARNLVRDVTGKLNSEAEVGLGETTPVSKVDVATVATRLFALLFLVKGIECCATSKSQGDHALDEVMHPYSIFVSTRRAIPNASAQTLAQALAHLENLNPQELSRFSCSMRTLVAAASQRGE